MTSSPPFFQISLNLKKHLGPVEPYRIGPTDYISLYKGPISKEFRKFVTAVMLITMADFPKLHAM